MRRILSKTLIVLTTLLLFICTSTLRVNGQNDEYIVSSADEPLVIKTIDRMDDGATERATIKLSSPITTTGQSLVIKLFLKDAYSGQANVVFGFNDGTKEHLTKSNLYQTLDATNIYGSDNKEVKIGLYESMFIPTLFYGEIVIPYNRFNNNASAGNITEFYIDITCSGYSSTWQNDNITLYLFEISEMRDNDKVPLLNLNDVVSSNIEHTISQGTNKKLTVRKANSEDMYVLESSMTTRNKTRERIGDVKIIENFELPSYKDAHAELARIERQFRFTFSGQRSVMGFESLNNSDALKYYLDSQDYDASKNAYAGIHVNFESLDSTDWSGAKGLTVYVKNSESYEVSFAVEFFQFNTTTGRYEQYNLNNSGNKYKTVYAYNTKTGEEFSYHTQTFTRIPANFEGWIRIPFSQYDAPEWSLAPDYGNKGVLDFTKNPVMKVSITRLFSSNQETTLLIDNIGVYYNDFIAGKSFISELPSIRECMEGGN